MEKTNELIKQRKGITLIALAITIAVLLILAGISINMVLGNKGMISKAREAAEETEIANEKEIVEISAIEAISKGGRLSEIITEENLRQALTNNIGSESLYNLTTLADKFSITFLESGRNYLVDSDGNLILNDIKIADKTPGDYTDGGKQDGTEVKPFKIESIEDLIAFERAGNADKTVFDGKVVLLMTDLDFKSSNSYVDSNNTSLFEDYNKDGIKEGIMKEVTKETEAGYQPMKNFTGVLDGQNHTIRNLYINKTDLADYLGFIAILDETGTIRNLNVEGNIKCSADSQNLKMHKIGGLLGINEGVIVENCSSNVKIEVTVKNAITNYLGVDIPRLYVGGLIGDNETNINDCENYGDITVQFERNKQDETSYPIHNLIGGVSAKASGSVQNCINYGKINYVGRKIGANARDSGSEGIGGIIGKFQSSPIKNCINLGNITTSTEEKLDVGGIASRDYENDDVENCYNRGRIQSTMEVNDLEHLRISGVIGDANCNVKNCYNRGEVIHVGSTQTKYIGAIVGDSHSTATYLDCRYLEMGTLSGAQGNNQDASGNPILKVPNLTEKDVIQMLNKNIQEHNSSSSDKWIEWKIVGDTIVKK